MGNVPEGRKHKIRVHYQLALIGNDRYEYQIRKIEKAKCCELNRIKAKINRLFTEGKDVFHKQKKLQDIFDSPIGIVFNAENLWREKKISMKEIEMGLYMPFPKYNISNQKMILLIEEMDKGLSHRQRVIIPKELLSLATLNYIDNYLDRKTASIYIKSRRIKDLSAGRRSCASRILKNLGYIEEFGNCWKRTEKVFDEKDFWPN